MRRSVGVAVVVVVLAWGQVAQAAPILISHASGSDSIDEIDTMFFDTGQVAGANAGPGTVSPTNPAGGTATAMSEVVNSTLHGFVSAFAVGSAGAASEASIFARLHRHLHFSVRHPRTRVVRSPLCFYRSYL